MVIKTTLKIKNVMNIKRIVLFVFFTTLIMEHVHSQNNEKVNSNNLFIHVNVPTVAYSSSEVYDCNILQSYGFGLEYVFKNRISLSFNFTNNIYNCEYLHIDKEICYNSLNYKPSIRYYLDTKSKLFLNIGATINSCKDRIREDGYTTMSEDYMQNAVTFGLGYKIYLIAQKRIGMEFSVNTNVFTWENIYVDWRNSSFYDNFNIGWSVFYRF